MQPGFQKVLGDRALQRRYGHQELIGAGAVLPSTTNLRRVMCDPWSRLSGWASATAHTGSVIDWMCLVASSIIT